MTAFISSRVWMHKALSQSSQYEVKIMCYEHKYSIIHVSDIITWLGEHSPVRPHCFIKLTWKWMRIASLQFLTFSWCNIVDSVCLHGHRAVLRKAYFVHIAVFLRHGKAYGKHSYAFPGVSDCVSAVISLCLRTWIFLLHAYEYILWSHWSVSQLSGLFQWTYTVQNMPHKQKNTTDPSVYYIEKWHIPLYSILVSPLTFMRKCDAVGFRLLLGVFNSVFLWEQTNGMGRE